MLFVGLTGGIGAGKSTVARLLAGRGAVVVDADLLAREVVARGTPGLAEVVNAFGPEVLTPDGSLDRPALGRIVFSDPRARERLNAVTHPRIAVLTRERVAAAPADAIVVHDVPLLVENRMGDRYHVVLVVDAPTDERVRRLVTDRGMTEQDALARIGAQADDRQRRAAADVVLDNGRDPAALGADVDLLWDRRLGPFEVNLRRGRPANRSARAVLVPPDPTWPEQAARLVARIRHTAGAAALRVDPIGSTAVAGLDAKDVLDVQVVVRDLAAAREVGDLLPGAGLVRLREGTWFDGVADGSRHEKVLAVNADPARTVNCHVRVETSPAWREALLLRDWLRATPTAAQEYGALKHRLAAAPHASIDEYAEAKTPWMASALERAQRWAEGTGWPEPGAGSAAED